jgi:N utilization substance protein B
MPDEPAEAPEAPRVRSRTLAREAALQALYSILQSGPGRSEALELALERHPLDDASRDYAREIYDGVLSRASGLDERYEGYLKKGWTPDRLALVERVILRLAVWELFHRPGIPPKVTIAEALRLAERFADASSTRFIHGILGRVILDSPKAEWRPEEAEVFEEDPTPKPDGPELVEAVEGSPEHQELEQAMPWVVRSRP